MGKMKLLMGLLMLVLMIVGCQTRESGVVRTNVPGYGELSISQPHTYKNMTLFVIFRTTAETSEDFITLEEGLAQEMVVVSEKEEAEVETVQVENLSDKPLFIQAGDTLKGGKQDRIIRVSLVIPPRSGKVDVPSLCVEAGRWTGQAAFIVTGNRVISNNMRIALQKGEQGQVWEEVAKFKLEASQIIGDVSKTSSLNEEMDDEKMKQAYAEYEKAFAKLLDRYPQAVGLAYALNGKIYTIELFQANGLFKKAYPKLLKAYASEAVVNPAHTEIKTVTNDDVKNFLAEMEKGELKKQDIKDNRIIQLENDRGITFAVKDKLDRVIHRQYVQK